MFFTVFLRLRTIFAIYRGLILIQKGEGGDKGGDSSLYFGWRLEVEEGWRNEAAGVLEEELLAVDWGGFVKPGEGIGLHSMYILILWVTTLNTQRFLTPPKKSFFPPGRGVA